ncbi:hypothetical protein [Tritonibacter sp. SIMBA_163]|uniref:hypothetical protein n=1 Tax=Tritonibacter sp. SIMBA_163 TaxID=3080868 RepID=UPI00397ECA42
MEFIARQKWDANLSAEDSLIALDTMERLGFEKRSEFIRHALTNPVLAEQNSAFRAVWQATVSLTELRNYVRARSEHDPGDVSRIESQLRDIHIALRKAISACPDRS